MVKIPTYQSQTQPKLPSTQNRPGISTGAEEVGNAVSRFADKVADVAMTVYEKNKRIKDDRLNTENLNEFTITHNDIFNKYKTSKDVENGATNYFEEAQAAANVIYERTKVDNPSAAEWFFNKSNSLIRGNYPSIENSIFTNNREAVVEDINDSKNLFFNTWLSANAENNRIVQQMQEENIFGSDTVIGMYDRLERANMKPNLSKAQFNKNLEDELSVLHANQLIRTDLQKFYELHDGGAYDGLEPETKNGLKKNADAENAKLQNIAIAQLEESKSSLKEEIKHITNVIEQDYAPDVIKIQDAVARAINLNQQLVSVGKDPITEELQDLNHAMDVYEFIMPIKNMTMQAVMAELNNINTVLANTSGTENFDSINLSKKKKLEEYIDFRKKNEKTNILGVYNSAGHNVQVIDFEQIDLQSQESMNMIGQRYNNALSAGLLYNVEPQFFMPVELQQVERILNSGSEEAVTKLISTVSLMSQELGANAFSEIGSIKNAEGIAHIGTLLNLTGETKELQAAIKAYTLKDDEQTKNLLNQAKVSRPEYIHIKQDMLKTFQMSPVLDNKKNFRAISNAADLIFKGLILNDPDAAIGYEYVDPDFSDKMIEAVNIAAGMSNGYGGIEMYNGHGIIVPGVIYNRTYHQNAEFGDGKDTLEEMLDNNMTDSLLKAAVSSMPYFPNELTTGGAREAKAEDLFDQSRVHLLPYGNGEYIFVYGDNPQTSDIVVKDIEGNTVIFDIKKIYSSIAN